MRRIYQDKFGDEGNCLQACIASLLGCELNDVPNFVDGVSWMNHVENFMHEQGYSVVINNCIECYPRRTFYLAWGKSPRGYEHSVVYWEGKLAHDPHPEGGGVKVDQIVYFVGTFNNAS